MMGSCPECNSKLSTEAGACPNCGWRVPWNQPVQNVTVKVEKSSSCFSEGCGCLIIIAGVLLLILLLGVGK